MLLYVWLYATFDGDRPLLTLLFFARIYYDSFMLLAYGFMPLSTGIDPLSDLVVLCTYLLRCSYLLRIMKNFMFIE